MADSFRKVIFSGGPYNGKIRVLPWKQTEVQIKTCAAPMFLRDPSAEIPPPQITVTNYTVVPICSDASGDLCCVARLSEESLATAITRIFEAFHQSVEIPAGQSQTP